MHGSKWTALVVVARCCLRSCRNESLWCPSPWTTVPDYGNGCWHSLTNCIYASAIRLRSADRNKRLDSHAGSRQGRSHNRSYLLLYDRTANIIIIFLQLRIHWSKVLPTTKPDAYGGSKTACSCCRRMFLSALPRCLYACGSVLYLRCVY